MPNYPNYNLITGISSRKKRNSISKKIKRIVNARAGNKCEHCRYQFKKGDTKYYHHSKGKPNKNVDSYDLELLCGRCHPKAHSYKTKTTMDVWGYKHKKKVLVAKSLSKVKPKLKKVKRAVKKRKPKNINYTINPLKPNPSQFKPFKF
ncbi:MAG: hypothetical protein KJ623_04110 [Nanoarchaeota archaeon]|nr:hypothetical protein [Nanoarchaeota archaeon]MBU0962866.1 hypothetical protein [Nanoarchaeota archaeon]